jgi:hypothetical protein
VGRRTNLALIAALAGATVTGVLALWVGAARAAPTVWAHGAFGLALVCLAAPRLAVVRRGWRRRRRDRDAAALTGLVAVAMLVAGLAHAAGARSVAGVTVLALHLALAFVLVPAVALHVVRRPVRPRRGDLTRAAFLRLAGLTAAAVATKAAWEVALAAERAASGSLPRAAPVPTSWIDDDPPADDQAAWRIAAGAGRHAPADLARLPRRSVRCALDCTGGWYSTNTWSGVPVAALVGPLPAGTRSVVVRSRTGYNRRFDVADLDRLLLATELDGAPLPLAHGAPARLVVPGRRGFWWVKWVDAIETSTRPGWWQSPFPLT